MATKSKAKRVVSGNKKQSVVRGKGPRKAVPRKSVRQRPAVSGRILDLLLTRTEGPLKQGEYGGRLLFGVRKEEDVDIEVLRHRERERRADQQEMKVLLGAAHG